ncbi:MAG: VPLPA-CTERM sorting domain-containing protein [Parvularculaceae bacterium]
MSRFIIAAAIASSLLGAAQARTVVIGDIVNAGGSFEIAGARLVVTAPAPVETLSRAKSCDAELRICSTERGNFCSRRAPARLADGETLLTVFLDEGVTIRNFSFDDMFAGEAPEADRTVTVNGIAYRLSELAKLSLAGPVISINLDAAAAQQLALRSFDLETLDAPLPAAGLLMIAGLGGITLATRKRKNN